MASFALRGRAIGSKHQLNNSSCPCLTLFIYINFRLIQSINKVHFNLLEGTEKIYIDPQAGTVLTIIMTAAKMNIRT